MSFLQRTSISVSCQILSLFSSIFCNTKFQLWYFSLFIYIIKSLVFYFGLCKVDRLKLTQGKTDSFLREQGRISYFKFLIWRCVLYQSFIRTFHDSCKIVVKIVTLATYFKWYIFKVNETDSLQSTTVYYTIYYTVSVSDQNHKVSDHMSAIIVSIETNHIWRWIIYQSCVRL